MWIYKIAAHISNFSFICEFLHDLSQLLRLASDFLLDILQSKIGPAGNSFQYFFLCIAHFFNSLLFLLIFNSILPKLLMKLTLYVFLNNLCKMGCHFPGGDWLDAEDSQGIRGIGGDFEDEAVILIPKENGWAYGRFIGQMDEYIGVVVEYHFLAFLSQTRHDHYISELGGPPFRPHPLSPIVGCYYLEHFETCCQNGDGVGLADLLRFLHPASVIHGGKTIISSRDAFRNLES
jgi:hypothetical protein